MIEVQFVLYMVTARAVNVRLVSAARCEVIRVFIALHGI